MKLIKAHATNYRNIIDSNPVEIGRSTCLVGKSEAGKTAFLKALECLRSTNEEFKNYGKTENYPRRYLSEYDNRHEDAEAVVMRTEWELEPADIKALEAALGEGVLNSTTITIQKAYEQDTTTWSVPMDEEKAFSNLVRRFALDQADRVPLVAAKSTKAAMKILEALPTPTERQAELLAAIKKFRDGSAHLVSFQSAIVCVADETPTHPWARKPAA